MALAFIKFFPTDYIADTRTLSTHTKGCYMDLLCLLHDNGGSVSKSLDALARFFGCSRKAAVKAIEELAEEEILEVSKTSEGKYELVQRRMRREEEEREYERTKKRKQRQGAPAGSEGEITVSSETETYDSTGQDRDNEGDKGGTIPEARDQKPEATSPSPPEPERKGGVNFEKSDWDTFCKHYWLDGIEYRRVKKLPDKVIAHLLTINQEKKNGSNIRDLLAVAKTRQGEPPQADLKKIKAWLHPPPDYSTCHCDGKLTGNYAQGSGETAYICQSCKRVYYKR